jgi:phospholipid transport system transporter-binding protein
MRHLRKANKMLQLPATLTHTQAQQCLQALKADVQREQDSQVVVDAGLLNNFDSSALAVLLALRRECARYGKQFAVQGVSERLKNLAVLYGVDRLLPSA